MNLAKPLTEPELFGLGFQTTMGSEPPRVGALLLCYHKVFGLTIGYYTGPNAFIFPFMDDYNWASHWRYHS